MQCQLVKKNQYILVRVVCVEIHAYSFFDFFQYNQKSVNAIKKRVDKCCQICGEAT